MKQYLIEIKKLLQHKENVTTHEGLVSEIVMNNPANSDETLTCQKSLKIEIPEDYKHFLNEFNGGIIFKVEDFAGYRFLGTNEMLSENRFQRENFGEDWADDVLLFGVCLGDNEYLGFRVEKKSYKILHCIMELYPDEWQIIDTNFDHFLAKLIRERGQKYWLENHD
ncbi:SMI1/KNR4 family protein [Fulvivirga ulvae]|uniref:SMI1/KNR4 family protein n=1 Tax=Fulvivirga ulvae TaxID=2904245 RepID=UPI001F34748F|nr:SMI1/KNR4 family protein [Fulvivirga ulvae]UII32806.1 SMI1/KNR4 family protein [Fulvivirga ulvae]